MDIWAWVENLHEELVDSGNARVADLLYTLPQLVCEDRISQAQALFPEALAAARALKNPWMEVFFRHWQMRLRLGALGEGETALPEAVALLEFAHRDECKDCPQSVCTTQDIAACYAYVDGPGWAPERKAVCLETLEKIDPKWNCYACITSEYADALKDEGRTAEALAYLESTTTEIQEAGREYSRDRMHQRLKMLLELGREEEALRELDRLETVDLPNDDEADKRDAVLLRALTLAMLKRADEAWEVLPNWDTSLAPTDYPNWLEAAYLILQEKPELNTWHTGAAFQQALAYAHSVGAHRQVIVFGNWHCRLALQRQASFTANRALEMMRDHLPRLRHAMDANQIIKDLEELSSVSQPAALPVPASELLAYLAEVEDRNPEKEIDLLLLALAELPTDTEIVNQASRALQAIGEREQARTLLRQFIEEHPGLGEDVIVDLIALTPDDAGEDLLKLAALMDVHVPFLGPWCRAHEAFRNADWKKTGEYLGNFLELRPKSIGGRRFWAEAAMRDKDFNTAARLRKELIDLVKEEGDDPISDRWDLLVAASAARDWRTVRQTCRDLGFEVDPGEEPIEDPGNWIRIRYYEDGDWKDHVAVRTGPATARILAVASPKDKQHVKDWVVFEPSPLEPWPEDPEEKENFFMPYHIVHTLEEGNCRGYMLDGVDPSTEEWEPFRDRLQEMGCALWIRSSSAYRVGDPSRPDGPEDEEEWGLPGIYIGLGIPAGLSLVEVDAALTELTKGWKHPLSWLELAADAGADTSRHEAVRERYGL